VGRVCFPQFSADRGQGSTVELARFAGCARDFAGFSAWLAESAVTLPRPPRNVFTERGAEGTMTRDQILTAGTRGVRAWVAGAAVVGALAGVAAAGLLWLVLTRPVALAEALNTWR
jgi:hypothetical protein